MKEFRLTVIFLILTLFLGIPVRNFESEQTNIETRTDSMLQLNETPPNLPDPSDIWWITAPTDQIVKFREPFEYFLNAVSINGLDTWWLNDTVNFQVNGTGSITNASSLSLGNYGLRIWVNDTLGEVLNASFRVTVSEFVEWTVLVYLDGDNDLEAYAFNDLNSMEAVWLSPEVRVIVFVDFWSSSVAPYSGARCYEITNDSDWNTINSVELSIPLPSEPNMGDWRTLRDFIVFGQSHAPAEKYLLVLWDHGGGYEYVCIDETSGDYLTMREVQQALSDPLVQYLDIVAFDACMMGQLEVAYELRDVTDYLVFSEEGIPLTGFPYEDILTNLTSHPTSSPLTFAERIPHSYIRAYSFGGHYYEPSLDWACLSTVDTSQLQDIATSLHLLSSEIYSVLDSPIVYERVCIARAFTQGFTRADFVDLGSFVTALSNVFSDSAYPMIQTLARDLSDAVQAAIVHEEHLSGVPRATGLAVVLNQYYDSLDLADDTIWDVFMDVFTDVGSNRGTAIGLSASGEYFGYLDWADDSFYYRFDPLVTGLYTFYLDALMREYSTDFDLYLYDEYNEVLASSTSSDSSESFTVFLEVGSTYYLEVYSYPGDSDGVGVFQLTVQQGVTILPQAEFWVFVLAAGTVAIVGVSIAIMVYMLKRGPPVPKPPPRHYTHPPDTPASQRSETMQFCAYCGALLPSQAQYCPACGSSV